MIRLPPGSTLTDSLFPSPTLFRSPRRFFYDRQGKGDLSDAAVLPDGRVLLIHRKLGIAPIFTTIAALLDPDDIRADRAVRSVEIGRVPKADRKSTRLNSSH